jgi:hypothetical protein
VSDSSDSFEAATDAQNAIDLPIAPERWYLSYKQMQQMIFVRRPQHGPESKRAFE